MIQIGDRSETSGTSFSIKRHINISDLSVLIEHSEQRISCDIEIDIMNE